MAIDNRRSRKTPSISQSQNKGGFVSDVGPYIGIVKNNVDPLRQGRLQVYVREVGGGPEDDPASWRTVSYASPFYGITPKDGTGTNSSTSSIKSYGMWFTPPDLGVRVLCIFVQGDPARGYYFASVPEAYSSHMLGGAGVSENYVLPDQVSSELPGLQNASKLPVTEINTKDLSIDVTSFQSETKPVDVELVQQLWSTGTWRDTVRGLSTSSAYRESPSQVFGISTPGRASTTLDSQTPDPNATVAETANSQTRETPRQPTGGTTSRSTGHQITLDDGDINGENQQIRLKTSTGHQILMNDDQGIIYVSNAAGTAWIELTQQGRMDVFAQGEISFHGHSINFHADTDISMYAGNCATFVGRNNIQMQGQRVSTYSESSSTHTSMGSMNIYGAVNIESSAAMNLKASGNIVAKAPCIDLNGSSAAPAAKARKIPYRQVRSTQYRDNTTGWGPGECIETISPRVPMHEPWDQHENINPTPVGAWDGQNCPGGRGGGQGIGGTPGQDADGAVNPVNSNGETINNPGAPDGSTKEYNICGNRVILTAETAAAFEKLCRSYGGNLRVNSHFRSGSSGQHGKGKALDISFPIGTYSMAQRKQFVGRAQRAGFTGFGLAAWGVHVDTGASRWWTYDQNNDDLSGSANFDQRWRDRVPEEFRSAGGGVPNMTGFA